MPDPIIVFGSGGHAKVIVEAILARTPDRPVILLDDAKDAASRSVFGIGVSGGRDKLKELKDSPVVPAIGDNKARGELLAFLDVQGHSLEAVVHPAAWVAPSVTLGGGAFISAGAIVIAEARLERGAIINTGASVDHDCVIGEAAHVGPGVHLCGNVQIGARTLVGVGSSVRPGIRICDDAIIGAGSVVVENIDMVGTFAGNPARALKTS